MSSTVTRFQAPVHTFGHPEPLAQQYFDYEFTTYSVDSRSLADTDAHSYAHAKDIYNPGSSYTPYYLQNNSYASPDSPQLLFPRLTLPPSQISPHFPWYDWPSEAPANIYQESVPNPLALSYLGDGYTQPFAPSDSDSESNNQAPTQSTQVDVWSGFYLTAHQPVPPKQHSSYSELTANIDFLNRHTQPPHIDKEPLLPNFSIPKDGTVGDTISSPDDEKNPFALGFDGLPLTAFGRKVPFKAPSWPVSTLKYCEPQTWDNVWDCPG